MWFFVSSQYYENSVLEMARTNGVLLKGFEQLGLKAQQHSYCAANR